jgi:serine/threonine-protein kinase
MSGVLRAVQRERNEAKTVRPVRDTLNPVAGASFDPFTLTGQILDGQYRVDAVVGEGGYGVVYRGWHLVFEQPIAIKALKMPEVHDAETRIDILTRFREEAKLCYVLSQASLAIVRCIGYGALVTPSQTWAPYLVLEWLEGRALSEDLDERRRRGFSGRTLAETIDLLAPAAQGLGYAHSQRVAHRDVKPANVFLVKDPKRPGTTAAKLLDFGIAKVMGVDATAANAAKTRGAFSAFTPFYAAPEQLDPRLGPTGPWTDVYGFARVLVEVLSGRAPSDRSDVIRVVARATDPTHRPTPRTEGVPVPDAVEAAFARALAVDPKARYGTVTAFWQDLTEGARAVSFGQGGERPTLDMVAPARPISRARFWRVALVVGILVSLGLAGGFIALEYAR